MKGKLLKWLAVFGCLVLSAGVVACVGSGGGKGDSSSVSSDISGNSSEEESLPENTDVEYTLSINSFLAGTITNAGAYKYGQEITTTATTYLGYEFSGWYSGERLLCSDTTYTFTITQDVTAKFVFKKEMSLFHFISTETTCTITAVRDETMTNPIIPDYVTKIGVSAFEYCYDLTKIVIPDSVTCIGDGAFFYCTSLTEIVIPDSVTSIGDHVFYSCNSLAVVSCPAMAMEFLPKSRLEKVVITSGDSIGDYLFGNCSSLTSVVIGDSVTSIGGSAFAGCSSLTEIVIPDSVTSIGDSVFYGCDSLTIYCEVESKPAGWNSSWNYSNNPVYWYRESAPTTSGKDWHYNENGEIVIW